jgi:hydrogenase maturation protease
MKASKRPGIICVGNADRADDALGPVCADMLAKHGLPVRVCPGDAFELLEIFRDSPAVFLVDAVVTGSKPPGTIYAIDGDSNAIRTASWTGSTHGLGVAEALRLAKALGVCPSRVFIYGVEASKFDWGEAMTPEVQAALPALVERIEADWRAAAGKTGR